MAAMQPRGWGPSARAQLARDVLSEDRLRHALVQADSDAARCAELLRRRSAAEHWRQEEAEGAPRPAPLTPEEEEELKRLRRKIWELAEIFGPTCDLWHASLQYGRQ
mmetsp:Transcript_28017/g.63430  ORF Transcript_28017/g.63430 Transcript_28017/m.63430 type:complete len:107 (-) Transcript_28017:135-455(-)